MHKERSFERRHRRPRPPFRRKNRHPGLAEREVSSRETLKPKGEIPASFASTVFGLVHPLIQHAVSEEGYVTPTPIQEQSIPALLEGRDHLGAHRTGKITLCRRSSIACYPASDDCTAPARPTPTRELAAQIAENTSHGRYTGLRLLLSFYGPPTSANRRLARVFMWRRPRC